MALDAEDRAEVIQLIAQSVGEQFDVWTQALLSYAFDRSDTQEAVIDAGGSVAYEIEGLTWREGAFTELTVDSWDPFLVSDDALRGMFASNGAGAVLSAGNAFEVRLTRDTVPGSSTDAVWIGRDSDNTAYIQFEGTPGSHTVGFRRLSAAAIATDDTIHGTGTAAAPLGVVVGTPAPPVSTTVSSDEKVARELSNGPLSGYNEADLTRLHNSLDAARDILLRRIKPANRGDAAVDRAVTVIAGRLYNINKQRSAETGDPFTIIAPEALIDRNMRQMLSGKWIVSM